jgi:hypothetical protein
MLTTYVREGSLDDHDRDRDDRQLSSGALTAIALQADESADRAWSRSCGQINPNRCANTLPSGWANRAEEVDLRYYKKWPRATPVRTFART